MSASQKSIQIDEEGYFLKDGERYEEASFGKGLLENLHFNEARVLYTVSENHKVIVEAFDQPLVVHQVSQASGQDWKILMPYGFESQFSTEALVLDEWDRFLGHTNEGIPFVFSRKAQASFFDQLDEFDDDSITVNGNAFKLPAWLPNSDEVEQAQFWTEKYEDSELPGWEIGQETPVLRDVLAQIKLNKCRVIVLGAGSGSDAAYLAKLGHLVTAVDMSPAAIAKAKEKYGNVDNLTFIESDVFDLDPSHYGNYDIIFEHTCYCAINPSHRNRLVKLWRQLLADGGHLLGVFFTWDKPHGPPFGGSEWEIRQRLKDDFRFLYWTRWQKSIPSRLGLELVVYAQKR